MAERKNTEKATRDVSIKVRRRDYDAARSLMASFPVDFIDVFSAMAALWKETPEKRRLEALKRVRPREPVPA